MLSSQETIDLFSKYVIPNYTRYPVALVRGEGSWVWDAEGKKYLDLFPGWGCNLLGHCPKPVVDAVIDQLKTFIHAPNSWYMENQGIWAKMLSERSFGGKAFFCNSGAEANEAAIKLVRLASVKPKYKIITFEGSFHGRTMGTLTATAQPKYQDGVQPLLPGFVYAPYGDLEAVRNLIDGETAAIMIEPVQGEGGVRVPPEGFLQGLRSLCDAHGLLLVFDEVQTGCGRLGTWFGYQHFGVRPDAMTLAKSISGGLAAGAMLTTAELAPALRPGMHASTFGGNPIAARAGIAAIEMIESQGLLKRAVEVGDRFRAALRTFQKECDIIREVRGIGTMVGVELDIDGTPIVQSCMENGLLINCTHGHILRLLPAMTMSDAEVDQGVEMLIAGIRRQMGK
ncbi:MAG: aspartate aminotransferase family protein [Thermoguttaceae bacterium]|nr:aspartate aminotransferase family protein [Thermoguttaceae bacterium]